MPKRTVIWSPEAKADLRAIDRDTARRILEAIDHYLITGSGDVITLRSPRREFRLRVGAHRVIFLRIEESTIEILRVRHRREAYR